MPLVNIAHVPGFRERDRVGLLHVGLVPAERVVIAHAVGRQYRSAPEPLLELARHATPGEPENDLAVNKLRFERLVNVRAGPDFRTRAKFPLREAVGSSPECVCADG
jgi:hypothetical protein